MKVTGLLAFGAIALAAPTQEANEGTRVPLARRRQQHRERDDGAVDMTWFLGELKYTLRKYNKNFPLPDILENALNIGKRDTNANEPLTDQASGGDDELYYGVGYVGAAAQKFTFDFDTGSSDTFIPGPSCGANQGCPGSTKYNQKGQDEHNTTTITYGSGSVSGENYFDSVTIAGLTATHQNIISLTTASGFSSSAADGLMGMAFQSIANSKQPPFFFSLINQGKVSPTEFSFYLGRSKSNTASNSEMTLGGRDSSKYTGAFTSVPVSSQTYWQVAIGGATAGTSSALISGTSGQAAIDTGTTLLISPTAAASAIYAKIPGSFMIPLAGGSTQLYGYPCSSSPNVSLSFAGKSFAVNNLDFNFGKLTDELGTIGYFFPSGSCLGGLAGADLVPGQSLWIVGDTFLKNWYSTFHYTSPSSASVNFAKAV